MPQSLANIYIHLIFSTKDRVPMICDSVRPQLHAYIATTLSNLKCPAVLINSVEDHIHLLFRLSKTLPLSKVVEDVKKSSSHWLKTQDPTLKKFAWQRGYGAFSVSESIAPEVAHYIKQQKEHHRTKTFQEEFRAFLTKHNISFDERYVWD